MSMEDWIVQEARAMSGPRTHLQDPEAVIQFGLRVAQHCTVKDDRELQRDGPIPLDDQFLGHLHEAAYDWGIESMEDEPVVARRAAIWFGRCIVTLIDEVRRLRATQKHYDNP